LYVPYADHDPLIVSKIPDIFATGHLHKTSVSTYRNVTLICGSCWQGKTAFQEKVGHNPEPGRVPLVNLQTREMRILRFGE
jgi:DNA polymerase II small subunit